MTTTTADEVIPFIAGDGRAGNVLHVVRSSAEGTSPGAPGRGPVLLAHGAGVRANIFRAPVPVTIVDALIDAATTYGWRTGGPASICGPANGRSTRRRLRSSGYAVRTVLEQTGHDRLKAIIHCQGSTSFMMSAPAGLLPEVNDDRDQRRLAAHGRSPARRRSSTVPPARPRGDPIPRSALGLDAPTPRGGDHRLGAPGPPRMHNTVCKQVSFTYGAGSPDAVAPREPQRRHPRMGQARIRSGAAQLLRADDALRRRRPPGGR